MKVTRYRRQEYRDLTLSFLLLMVVLRVICYYAY